MEHLATYVNDRSSGDVVLRAFPVAGKKKARLICDAFIQGAPRSASGAVFYGVNETNIADWRREQALGHAWFIDNSWFDVSRGTYYRVCRNAPQIDGTGTSDGKRFAALGIDVQPWRQSGSHIVLCPQSDSFMRTVAGIDGWATWAHDTLRRLTRRDIRVRDWSAEKIGLSQSLADDLQDAWALAAYCSSAAVTALVHGVPILTQYGATLMMGRDLEHVESPIYPADRERFFGVLADNQWSLDEFKNGEAWRMLNGG